MSKTDFIDVIYRWRVRYGLFGVLLAAILARPTLWSIAIGFLVCIPGLLIRCWACGNIRKEKKLAMTGPYRYTRNPLYFGNLILGIGIVIGARSWFVLGIFIIYFLVFYPIIINQEKKRMNEFFPEEYEEYKNKTPLFFPTLKPSLPQYKQTFSWTQYRRNREIRALTGVLIFWAIMIVKALFIPWP
jgi:protein-S-isoprenylcysteine O-methyltransferase Ste14